MTKQELKDIIYPNGWMTTYLGHEIDIFEPDWRLIEIFDIAHALSLICRFGGHTKKFYSVAQHSVMVAHLVDEPYKLEALLHDATEAYCGDLIRPIKASMPNYKQMEIKLSKAVNKKFGLHDSKKLHKLIKYADNVALVTEKRDLKNGCNLVWTGLEAVQPLQQKIVPASSKKAEREFLKLFFELQNGRTAK